MIYQQQEALFAQKRKPAPAQWATVSAVHNDGVTLIFDGETSASSKHYRYNTALSLAAGDRVKVAKMSGTYVVEYKI